MRFDVTEEQRENARQWVAKLRSGEYIQTTSVLRANDDREGHKQCCCLGVALDMIDPDGWGEYDQINMGMRHRNGAAHHDNRVAYPKWSWFLRNFGTRAYRRYARMNDNGADFNEIADAIERDFGLHD